MKFKFQKNLEYQKEAVDSVVGLFEGMGVVKNSAGFQFQNAPSSVVQNTLNIDKNLLLSNLRRIQKENGIEVSDDYLSIQDGSILTTEDGIPISLGQSGPKSLDFSVEMETGTGKTYVYLRTILELYQKYGLTKFIILVPSVAIREGVLKTIEQTKEHFRDLYNTGFSYFSYDSKKLSRVRDFAQSTEVQVMIMTIQSFNSDTNILRQDNLDRFYGERPIDIIAETKPVIVMDEPQNMESELAQSAVEYLKPLFKLRYSATHKSVHNLVYRLSPVDAYRQGLVKKIAVYGIKEDNPNDFIFKIKEFVTEIGKNPQIKAVLEIKESGEEYRQKEMKLSAGDSLFRKSKNNDKYVDLVLENIDAKKQLVELSNGSIYQTDKFDEDKEVVFRTQIKETIKAHFQKQQEVGESIKVLSLFFIDKVDNYIHSDSLIRQLFNEEFALLAQHKNYKNWGGVDVSSVHRGYFASKKVKGEVEYKDSTGRESKEDRETFNLIMKDKERLLSFSESVSFIFSHSALREGWDNPNIFQICTLRETNSPFTKRQQIGRGLRLPVNCEGNRVYDPEINVLTVVANESYEEYARSLQQEFIDAGYKNPPKPVDPRKKVTIKTTNYINSEEFKELWEKISKKTKYKLELFTKDVVENSVADINENLSVASTALVIERGIIDFDGNGNVNQVRESTGVGYSAKKAVKIGDVISRVALETGLTRKTILDIFSRIDNLELILENTEGFIREVIKIIKINLNNILINKGLKYTPTGDVWELNLFDNFETFESKVLRVKRSVQTHVTFDSDGERKFAENLDSLPSVKVFTKLPFGFRVDTPFGEYNPDWAVVKETDTGDKLYLVRETKFVDDLENLRPSEKNKIKSGKKHFKALGVNFKAVQKVDMSDLE